jgi:chemotaxis protein CheX
LVVDVNLLNPFVGSVDQVFSTMLGVNPKRLTVKLDGQTGGENVVSALVGISGQWSGVVALRFPPTTALNIAGRMLDCTFQHVDDTVIDAVAEIANMVGGSAKAVLKYDPPLQLGLPTVVEGAGYKIRYPSKSVWLQVPFHSEAGDFVMEFTYVAG